MLKAEHIRSALRKLLEDSGAQWQEEQGLIRFRLRREGMIWETACRCLDGRLLVYGRYPFPVGDRAQGLAECSRINSRTVQGAMFLPEDGQPVFRTGAALDDPYDARLRMIRALEYNAAVITHFWGNMAGCGNHRGNP